MAQNTTLPFSEIPEYAANYESGNIVKRFIDGLGYRYYWASEGLTAKDLAYRPSADSRDMHSTLVHIYGLSEMIKNAALDLPNLRPSDYTHFSYEELRSGTLKNLEKASNQLENMSSDEVSKLKITVKNGDKERTSEYWHMLNGPISDAIYHVGQVVVFRRTSGNPINPKVNVFEGKNRS
jgi:uncharacterized damage-inducible protein DinB